MVEVVIAVYGAVGLVQSGVLSGAAAPACPWMVRVVCVLGVAFSFLLVPSAPLLLLCFFDPLGHHTAEKKAEKWIKHMDARGPVGGRLKSWKGWG